MSRLADWTADWLMALCLVAACIVGIYADLDGWDARAAGPHIVLNQGREQ